MAKGNQINLGESVTIDTDEVQLSVRYDDADPPYTWVGFKNNQHTQLRVDAKAAFDAWAESLRPVAEAGRRALCQTCGLRNVRSECLFSGDEMSYPECYEDEEE